MRLTDQNYKQYALQHYDNPSCSSAAEFEEDLARVRYVKRLCHKYRQTGLLKERLILNHMVVLHNLFGNAMIPMLFLKVDKDQWDIMVPFLKYLDLLPPIVTLQNGEPLNTGTILGNTAVKVAIDNLLEK